MLISGAWFAVFSVGVFPGGLGFAMGAFALLGSVLIGIAVINGAMLALSSKLPALIIDEEGITYVEKTVKSIAWQDIERASSNEGDGNELGIWLRPEANTLGKHSLRTKIRRAISGADIVIPLGNLVYRPRELAAILAKFVPTR